MVYVVILLFFCDDYGSEFSAGRRILSRAVEFALCCCGILIVSRNFAEVEK